MVKLPGGITTISGHLSHSLKTSFGLSAHSSAADRGPAARFDRDAVVVTAPHGLAGEDCGATTAICCGGVWGTDGPEELLLVEGIGGVTAATLLLFKSSKRERAMLPKYVSPYFLMKSSSVVSLLVPSMPIQTR